MKNVCLVIPTIREESFNKFVKKWGDIGLFDHVDLLVIEDNPKKTFAAASVAKYHFSWEEIDQMFDKKTVIIPRRSDTVRSAGYWYAWKQGYPYIMTLDDDCYPPTSAEDGFEYENGGKTFVDLHIEAIENKSRWFNTLNDVKPRGIPFYNIGKNSRVVMNHGLWTNVLDYDAPTQLVAPTKERFKFDSRIVPRNQYYPMCGMNVMWKRDVTVLMYHLLMGQEYQTTRTTSRLPFDRFGDIWCGIFSKKILDARGYFVSTGTPYIRHDRASNPFANLKKEANGLEVNENLWEYVDKHVVSINEDLVDNYEDLGVHISGWKRFPEYDSYFQKLGTAMIDWAHMFREKDK